MIAEAEIRRLAARWRVDPMIPDLDYTRKPDNLRTVFPRNFEALRY
jgi:hypothetical protein